ncbi:MAG: hypothetical protein CSA45_06365 [Gammaproteobacteria bacterium]|nr:MAG: hypothetical protein CSA45_06365 [Gammaproteobacteria bacterium]
MKTNIKERKSIAAWVLAGVLALGMTTAAWAQDAKDALNIVKEQVSVVLADLKANKSRYESNPAALNDMIDSKMVQYFDTETMARLVLGKHWKNASKDQQQTFLKEFKQLIMRTYSKSLLDYTNATVTYDETLPVKKNRTKISATINNSDGKSYPLKLSMAYRNGQWKGYDVSVDGLSVITSYRSSIGEEVAKKGLQTVIDEIKELNRQGKTK